MFYVVNRDNFRKYQMDSENVEEELRKLEELAKDSAVGETMYDKKFVIEKILEVGKHFQQTSYIKDGELRELEKDIEEKLCTLWDISVEEDVSEFYLEHGVLDIFIELFSNPNNRVKEIAAGIMSNMVSHPTVFLKLMEVDKYLESCSKLLEEKDSPTLVVTLRILHFYSFNLFQLLNSDERQRRSKEDIKNVLNRFLVFLSLERIARNIGIIVASCTNKEVLLNASKFLSIFSEKSVIIPCVDQLIDILKDDTIFGYTENWFGYVCSDFFSDPDPNLRKTRNRIQNSAPKVYTRTQRSLEGVQQDRFFSLDLRFFLFCYSSS